MLGLSIWKLAIIGGIIVLMFGRGRISETMGDLANGIKAFKRGMSDDEKLPKTIDQKPMASQANEKASG